MFINRWKWEAFHRPSQQDPINLFLGGFNSFEKESQFSGEVRGGRVPARKSVTTSQEKPQMAIRSAVGEATAKKINQTKGTNMHTTGDSFMKILDAMKYILKRVLLRVVYYRLCSRE